MLIQDPSNLTPASYWNTTCPLPGGYDWRNWRRNKRTDIQLGITIDPEARAVSDAIRAVTPRVKSWAKDGAPIY